MLVAAFKVERGTLFSVKLDKYLDRLVGSGWVIEWMDRWVDGWMDGQGNVQRERDGG